MDFDVQILVSICMITYNHEHFITEAIEGVLMQETNFKFELIIGEDFSTDHTRSICQNYASRFPDIVKLVLPKKNIGANQNFINTYSVCQGQFIALCEGDDYWIDKDKLQKQVDFFMSNPEFSICFHSAYEISEGKTKNISNSKIAVGDTIFTLSDLSLGNFMHTPTVMLRRNCLKELPEWFNDCFVGDYPLYLLYALKGKIKFIPEPMAVYRIHHSSAWSSLTEEKKWTKWLDLLKYLDPHFPNEIKDNFKKQQFNVLLYLAEFFQNLCQHEHSINILSEALIMDQRSTEIWLRDKYLPLVKLENEFPKGVKVALKNLNDQFLIKIKTMFSK